MEDEVPVVGIPTITLAAEAKDEVDEACLIWGQQGQSARECVRITTDSLRRGKKLFIQRPANHISSASQKREPFLAPFSFDSVFLTE
jgi:hypothetical protein